MSSLAFRVPSARVTTAEGSPGKSGRHRERFTRKNMIQELQYVVSARAVCIHEDLVDALGGGDLLGTLLEAEGANEDASARSGVDDAICQCGNPALGSASTWCSDGTR